MAFLPAVGIISQILGVADNVEIIVDRQDIGFYFTRRCDWITRGGIHGVIVAVHTVQLGRDRCDDR